jgi:hypothetical protein
MPSITPTAPARKASRQERHATLGNPVNNVYPLLLTVGKQHFGYYLEALPSDIGGRAFRLTKVEHQIEEGQPDHYDVHLDGASSSCECLGHLRHHHCKHQDVLRVLLATHRI